MIPDADARIQAALDKKNEAATVQTFGLIDPQGDPRRVGNVGPIYQSEPGRPADEIRMPDSSPEATSKEAFAIGSLTLRPVESFYVGQYEVVNEAGKRLRNNAGLEAIYKELASQHSVSEQDSQQSKSSKKR